MSQSHIPQGTHQPHVRRDFLADKARDNEQACYDQALRGIGQGACKVHEIHWHKDNGLACPSIVHGRRPHPQCYWVTEEDTRG